MFAELFDNRRAVTLTGALASLLASTLTLAQPITGSWTSSTNFSYKLEQMPDLDQMRQCLPAVPLLQSQCQTAQPNTHVPGGMYCGPTTGTNLIVFMANHGYPTLLPAGQLGDIWEQPGSYDAGTQLIKTMGSLMSCAAGATVCGSVAGQCTAVNGVPVQGFANGLRRWIGNQSISVSYYLAGGAYSPTLNQIAATGLNKSLMGLAFGYYRQLGTTPQGVPIVQRAGGHFVTVVQAARNGAQQKLKVRNPADKSAGQATWNICAQSAFRNEAYDVESRWVLIYQAPLPSVYRWVSRMIPAPGAGVAGAGGGGGPANFLIMDAVAYARPKQGLAIQPGGGLVAIGPGGGAWGPGGGLACAALDFGAPAIDAVMHPDMVGAVVIAGPAAGVAGGKGRPASETVQILDSGTGQTTTLAEIPGATKLVFGRNRALYVLAGDSIHLIDLPADAEEALPVRQDPPAKIVVRVPFAAQAMTYDDQTDELVLLSLTGGKFMRYAADLGGEPLVQDVPKSVPLGKSGGLSINPVDDKLWLVSDASDSLFGLSKSPRANGELEVEVLSLPRIVGPRGLDFDDQGHMIVSTAGGLVELQQPDKADAPWAPVLDSEFGRLACQVEDVIRVDRSRNNFDPKIHDVPEWEVNIEPVELLPGVDEPDPGCLGDLNGDDAVNNFDLAILLGAWGPNLAHPADLDGNGIVNGIDLAFLLGRWGPCHLPVK